MEIARMLENELYEREFNDDATGGRGAGELNPSVPAAVFQPPQVMFQPPTVRPEPAQAGRAPGSSGPAGADTGSGAGTNAGTNGSAEAPGRDGDDDAAGRRR